MKKYFLSFALLLVTQTMSFAQIQTIWQNSSATNNLPAWFSSTESSETGIAYRHINGQNRLYVVSNKSGTSKIIILNADTGDSVGTLNTTGISGGTFELFDVEVSFINNIIYACNYTINPSNDAFKIYLWETETSIPKIIIIDSISTGIWGEKFTYVWGFAGISSILTIGKNTNRMIVYKKGFSDSVFIKQEISLPFVIAGNNPTATNMYLPFDPPYHFYINEDGRRIKEVTEEGMLIATDTILNENNNSIKSYFNYTLCCDNPHYITFQYGNGKENAAIVQSVNVQYSNFYAETPTLGSNPNPFHRGDVAIGESVGGGYNPVRVFVLSANNGVACYLTGLYLPVELICFTYKAKGDIIQLDWSTSSEKNNRGFEIQRKNSAEAEFIEIGLVEGKGTTTEIQNYSFNDNNPEFGKNIYRLKQIDFDESVNYSQELEVLVELPRQFSLIQNYPNPFNPSTKIKYAISSEQYATLKVYDILGHEIETLVNEEKSSGTYEVTWNAVALPSGVYFYQLRAGNFVQGKKMILLR